MSNPWRVLGVTAKATRDEVRRAYAKKLKVTNPEDDPDGFKRLREAYDEALQRIQYKENQARWAEAHDAEVANVDILETADDEEEGIELAPPPEPTEEERELHDLWTRLAALGDYFDGDAPRDDDHARALFDGIVAHPAMEGVDARARTEYAIGSMIAQNVPRSDAILVRAIRVFDWDRLGVGDQWPFSAARARYEEWRLIQALEGPSHKLNGAWKLLTRKPGALRRRISAYLPVGARMRDLIEVITYVAPGLSYSVPDAELDWWRERLQHRTTDVSAYGAVALQATVVAVPFALLDAWTWALGVFLAVVVVAGTITARFGHDGDEFSFNPNVPARLERVARWWPLAFAAMPFLCLFSPAGWAGIAMTGIAGAVTLLLMTRAATGPRPPFSDYWSSLVAGAVAMGAAGSGLLGLPPERLAAFVPLAFLIGAPLVRLQTDLLLSLDRALKGFGFLAVLAYGALLVGVAAYPAGSMGIAFQAALLACIIGLWGLIWQLFASQFMVVRLAGMAARGAMFFAIFGLFGSTNPLNSAVDASNGQRIVAAMLDRDDPKLEDVRAALFAMRKGNPALRAEIARVEPLVAADPSRARDYAGQLDERLDAESGRLITETTNDLMARWARMKVDILTDLKFSDPKACVDPVLQLGAIGDPELAAKVNRLLLAIAAAGPSREPNPLDMVAKASDLYHAELANQKLANELPGKSTSLQSSQTQCSAKIARAMAFADLPPDVLGPTMRLGKVKAAPPPSATR